MVKGIIIRISGPVVDVKFENGLPKIKDALTVGEGKTQKVMEVAQHLDERTVRCVMLSESEGLSRGTEVVSTGRCIEVPVGERTLGRMFNVLGQPIDGGGRLRRKNDAAFIGARPRSANRALRCISSKRGSR